MNYKFQCKVFVLMVAVSFLLHGFLSGLLYPDTLFFIDTTIILIALAQGYLFWAIGYKMCGWRKKHG